MIQSKRATLIALAIPIFALAGLVVMKVYLRSTGKKVVLPIEAFDPRDILAGHYMTYSIDYGIPKMCDSSQTNSPAYVCLEPKQFSYAPITGCQLLIKGTCRYNRFAAGIERFYIPQEKAASLQQEINNKKASIVLSVTSQGHAQVVDFLIDGKSWQD